METFLYENKLLRTNNLFVETVLFFRSWINVPIYRVRHSVFPLSPSSVVRCCFFMVQITCSRDLTVVVGPGGWQLLQGDFCPVGRQEGQMIQAGVVYPSESLVGPPSLASWRPWPEACFAPLCAKHPEIDFDEANIIPTPISSSFLTSDCVCQSCKTKGGGAVPTLGAFT